jgi:hypothetical protein
MATLQDTTLEPVGLLPSHPTLRPADIALHLIPSSLPTKLLMDITTTSMPAIHNDEDPSLASIICHHVHAEHAKFQGRCTLECQVIHQEFLARQYALLPITFHPGGQIGPLFWQFLWSDTSAPSTFLQSPPERTNSPFAMFSISSTHNIGFLHKADQGWINQYGSQEWYTFSSAAILPSQWFLKITNARS